ncbi:MAG TPA: hypothetical protein VNT24_00950, partial [Propionibacteriaceae bacterium]|nr:hypothetical protein [Propionibacteriaceae bacterium]
MRGLRRHPPGDLGGQSDLSHRHPDGRYRDTGVPCHSSTTKPLPEVKANSDDSVLRDRLGRRPPRRRSDRPHRIGALLQQRINDDAEGWALLLDAFAAHDDTAESPIPVAIETSQGLLVSCLRATGRPVFAI